MWDVVWFDQKYNFKDFDVNNVRRLIEDLKIDFFMDVDGNPNFQHIQRIIFNLLQKIVYFGNVSGGKLPCSHIWKILFTETFIENVKQKDKSFYDLYYFFDDRTKWFRKKDKSEEIKSDNLLKDVSDHLKFMGLEEGFTGKELKRRYRILCLKFHPDKPGGSIEEFNRLQSIRRELEKIIK